MRAPCHKREPWDFRGLFEGAGACGLRMTLRFSALERARFPMVSRGSNHRRSYDEAGSQTTLQGIRDPRFQGRPGEAAGRAVRVSSTGVQVSTMPGAFAARTPPESYCG